MKRALLPALPVLLVAACASTEIAQPFSTSGRVWPATPQEARIAFVSEFSEMRDLGIRPSFYERVLSFAAGSADQSMVRPMAVAATSDSQVIFVADPDAGCVHRYDLEKRRYHCLSLGDGTEINPVGLAVIDDALLVVSDSSSGQLYKAGIRERELRAFNVSEKLEQPTGVYWNSGVQRLFITDTARQHVLEFDREGSLKRIIGGRGAERGKFNFPTYVWANGQNELLVTDSLNFRIQRFDEEGQFLHAFGENGDRPGDFARPKGVATDQFGHVYVVDALMHAMQIFDREGELLLAIGEQGQGEGQFWLPNGIFVTHDNMIFVADSYNKRVQVFRYVGPET
jgi:sugar lactone lactonase YvrE